MILFPHLFAMKWWDWMPWSSFFECWVLSQPFYSPLPPSSRSSFNPFKSFFILPNLSSFLWCALVFFLHASYVCGLLSFEDRYVYNLHKFWKFPAIISSIVFYCHSPIHLSGSSLVKHIFRQLKFIPQFPVAPVHLFLVLFLSMLNLRLFLSLCLKIH